MIPLILRDFLYVNYFIKVYLILLCGLFGQNIRVTTESGKPLPYTFITHINSGKWVQSNENGYVQIHFSISSGDSIQFYRFGYHTEIHQWPLNNNQIILNPNPFQMKTVFSVGGKVRSNIFSFNQQSIKSVPLSGVVNHEKVLETLPGLSIRTFGGPGSISSISINGGPTSQTQVKIGEFDLTNIQTGMADLSQLPYPFIESATLISSGEDLEGSGSQNGTLSLLPWNRKNSIVISSGSFGHSSFHTTFSLSGAKHQASFLFGNRHELGNFPVQWKDESFLRTNNHFNQTFGAFQSKGMIRKNMYLQTIGLFSSQDRGVPGLVWSPSLAAHQDELNLLGITMGWMNPFGDGKIRGMIRQSNETYADPTYNIQTNHKVSSKLFSINQKVYLTPKITSTLAGEFNSQSLLSSIYSHSRESYVGKIGLDWNLAHSLEIKSSFRQDYSENIYNESTQKISVHYSPKMSLLNSIRILSSTHFRFPTFNDLYWEPGGNPDLQPENGNQQSIDFHFSQSKFGQLQIHYFISETHNLIQWVPLLTYWQPKNISYANRSGWTAKWNWAYQSIKTHLSYSSIYTNNEENDKPLRYAPSQLWTLTLDWNPSSWLFHTQIHGASSMISTYSWPEDIIIPSHQLLSGSIGKSFMMPWVEILTVLSIDNATNIQYESSKGYPEAGRSFRFTLTLNQKKKGNQS